MIVGQSSKSFPVLSTSRICDTTTTDETDESSEINSPRGPTTWSGITPHHGVLASQPHYQFRKSNSMKLALKEDEEEGRYDVVLSTFM